MYLMHFVLAESICSTVAPTATLHGTRNAAARRNCAAPTRAQPIMSMLWLCEDKNSTNKQTRIRKLRAGGASPTCPSLPAATRHASACPFWGVETSIYLPYHSLLTPTSTAEYAGMVAVIIVGLPGRGREPQAGNIAGSRLRGWDAPHRSRLGRLRPFLPWHPIRTRLHAKPQSLNSEPISTLSSSDRIPELSPCPVRCACG